MEVRLSRLRTVTRAWLSGGVLLAVGACSDIGERTGPSQPPTMPALPPGSQGELADDPVGLAGGVRGFGGFFLDRQGVPTVYLTDPAQRDVAATALAPFLSAQGMDRTRLRVLHADFEYARLESWFESASPAALSIPGAVFVDLDEASNRLRVGVADAAVGARVRRALGSLRVPADAVIVEETAPIRQVISLQDRVRPVRGGLMIDFILGLCTLGFNARRNGQLSFVTASHCTWAQGGTEGTMWWQHTWADLSGNDNAIGTEVADPVYLPAGSGPAGCPATRVCRYSDAARGVYSVPPADVALGRIAKTAGVNSGSIDIVGSFQLNTLTPEYARDRFAIGKKVHKVGMATGWTRAAVSATCVNVNVDGTSITQLCQTLVGSEAPGSPVIVGAGDSGSPIFLVTSNGTARLAGILWGGTPEGTLLAFSPLKNVQRELGDLVVIGP